MTGLTALLTGDASAAPVSGFGALFASGGIVSIWRTVSQ